MFISNNSTIQKWLEIFNPNDENIVVGNLSLMFLFFIKFVEFDLYRVRL